MKTSTDITGFSHPVKALILIHSLWLMFVTVKYCVQEAAMEKMNDSISDINEKRIKDMEDLRREINMIQLQQVVEVQNKDKDKKDHTSVSRQQTQQTKDTRSKIYPAKENILNKPSTIKDHDRNKYMKENKPAVDAIESPSSHDKYNDGDDTQKRNLNQIDLNMNFEGDNRFTQTSCFLVDEIDMTMMSYSDYLYSMAFDLRMNIKTDGKLDQSWTLMSQDGKNGKVLIDSKSHTSTTPNNLKIHTLHSFDYKCFVSTEDETKIQKEDREHICYDFEIYSEYEFLPEYCCDMGIDHFTVSVNNNTVLSDRLYGRSLTASFCLNDDGKLIDEEKKKPNAVNKYPSRECVDEKCICDTNPTIMNFYETEYEMYNINMNTLAKMMFLSGSEKLRDIKTPQYKAACWILYDDPFFGQQKQNQMRLEQQEEHRDKLTFISSSRIIEKHMIQRYILAVFYFATSPEQWNNHYHFLSSRSECRWNSKEEFYNGTFDNIRGILCDEDENVFSINFYSNNLKGTIIDEIFGFEKLEQLILRSDEYLYGPIPSSLGKLSELRDLAIVENSVQGSIPIELFQATKMQRLVLRKINLTGTIPKYINNLELLSLLELSWSDDLTGNLPEEIYKLENLAHINLYRNRLSGTISESFGNWKKLEYAALHGNEFTGTLSVKDVSRLRRAFFQDNNLSGNVPDFSMLKNLEFIWLHENNFVGDLSDQCDSIFKEGAYNESYGRSDFLRIAADCRNDVFEPEVYCSCCFYCKNDSPIRNGECGDIMLTIEIDPQTPEEDLWWMPMNGAIWSLEDDSTGQTVFSAKKYFARTKDAFTFEACIAKSGGCYSIKTIAPSKEDRNFTIFSGDYPIYNGTFLGYENNDDIYPNSTRTVVSFQYDVENGKIRFDDDALCSDVKMICDDKEIIIKPNTTDRILYNSAIKISSSEKFQDVTSNHYKSLCWLLRNVTHEEVDEKDDFFMVKLTQQYVLTLLHVQSEKGLFGDDEYPPQSHECYWPGVQCKGDTSQIVTTLSLGDNQTMGGTLIEELGSLSYLERLILSRSDINGTIPLEYSNLWRLVELDLSGNNLSGTIPNSFFRQLDKIEQIDLSQNKLSGSIPRDMGSYSRLRTVVLNNNELTGSFPLDGFKYHELKNFDVSMNALSEIDLSSLLIQVNLKTFDISANIFGGTLEENTFVSLSKLIQFNISQNEFSGALPSKFPTMSNITDFDVHANRLRGTIPIGITELARIQHLNLQGNEFTGSIPTQMNKLSKLNTLVLSHNAFKGSIPLDLDKLLDLKRLYLHSNELSGEAPHSGTTKMYKYITDCGVPSEALDPVKCPSCNICCNSDNECNSQITSSVMKPMGFALSFILSVLGLMAIIYSSRRIFKENKYMKNYFDDVVDLWRAPNLIAEKSVYHFLLIPDMKGWLIGFSCALIQLATLFLFVAAADTTTDETDMEYSMSCPKNSLECEDTKSRKPFGYLVFALLLAAWLLKDIVGSFKLFLLSMQQCKIDFFFASSVIMIVTLFSASTSIYYNLAIATKDTDIITNAVILLFVNEIDERLYQLAETCDLDWVRHVNEATRRDSYFERKHLIIYRGLHKVRKRIRSLLGIEKLKSLKYYSNGDIVLSADLDLDQKNEDDDASTKENQKEVLDGEEIQIPLGLYGNQKRVTFSEYVEIEK